MKILAVDPGDQRIGLAVSDPTGTLARPLEIIQHEQRDADAARVAAVASEQEAVLILVGEPLGADGQPTPQSHKARRLAAAIREHTEIDVIMWDESGSSQAAQAARIERGVGREGRQAAADAEAAALILQSYLDYQWNQKE
jgi:putative Holliday junction resolvase